jgi:hypothetical protein
MLDCCVYLDVLQSDVKDCCHLLSDAVGEPELTQDRRGGENY